jgi:N-acetylmuramoyl-L-alanine amidase
MSLSTRKKTILKQIYLENLRVAGKLVPKEIPAAIFSFKRFLFVLVVILPLAVISLSELELLIFSDESLPQADLPPKPLKMDNMRDFSIPDITELTDFWEPTWDHLSYQIPTWSLSRAKGQKIDDYRLLFSKNDYARLSSLFGLRIKTIVIDPGHGGKDPGAIGAKGTKEKDITLDVALRLKQKMTDLDRFNIFLTRQEDKFLTLAERVDFAKEKKADLFLSIHVNSLPNEDVNLIETYYFGPPLTSEIFRLAEEENKASQYSVSELIEIIQDINNTVKRQESEMLAGAIQSSLYNHLSKKDPEVINSGVKMAPFVVLSQIEVPSVLVEISCITNDEEEAKLTTSKYREKVASYITEGVVTYLDLNQFQTENGEQKDE